MATKNEDGQGPVPSYEVGDRKPPKHTQFKPGHSGNPKGRPKGSYSLATLVEQQMQQTVTVTSKGKSVKMPKKQVIAIQLVDNAAKGDLKSAQFVLQLEAQFAASTAAQASSTAVAQLPNKDNLKFLAGRLTAIAEEGE